MGELTPWGLIGWATAGAVALVILGIGLSVAILMVSAARDVGKGKR